MKPPNDPDAAFEDGFGPAARWMLRAMRPVRWSAAGGLGRSRDILIELRWRLGDEIMARPVVEAVVREHPGDRIWLWTNYPELFADVIDPARINDSPARPHRYIFLRHGPRTEYRPACYARRAGVVTPDAPPRIPVPALCDGLLQELEAIPGPRVAVAPGASWPSKRWPAERWGELCARLSSEGVNCVELGYGDEPIPGVAHSMMNRTSVAEAAAVLARCELAVACDSGLMHLALAVGTPVVGLFGPTNPDFLVRSPDLHAVASTRECAGFWNQAVSVPEAGACLCGESTCLADISVDTVAARVESELGVE